MFNLIQENELMFDETKKGYLKVIFQSIVIFLSIIILSKFKKLF